MIRKINRKIKDRLLLNKIFPNNIIFCHFSLIVMKSYENTTLIFQ